MEQFTTIVISSSTLNSMHQKWFGQCEEYKDGLLYGLAGLPSPTSLTCLDNWCGRTRYVTRYV